MEGTLLIRGADGRSQTHDKPVGVFFCGDPQIDTLMPASLLNGFALGQGRIGTDVLFPFFEAIIKALASEGLPSTGQTVGERLMSEIKETMADGVRLQRAVAEHFQEANAFARNKVPYPYNLLRDFEERAMPSSPAPERSFSGEESRWQTQTNNSRTRDKMNTLNTLLAAGDLAAAEVQLKNIQENAQSDRFIDQMEKKQIEEAARNLARLKRTRARELKDEAGPQLLHHNKGTGKAVAYELSSMASLEATVAEWSQGTLVERLAKELAPAHVPDFVVIQLGKYRNDNVGGGIVLVVLQLALDVVTLIDKYTDDRHAPTLELLHLGPKTVPLHKQHFFDDMLELEEAISTRQVYGVPMIRRLRFWQSHLDSQYKGAIVAFQAIYTDSVDLSTEFRTPIRGQKHGAQLFVDFVLSEGEFILNMSCFYVAGLYGSITVETNASSYTVGAREAGSYHKVEIARRDLFDVVAFIGETGRDETLSSLKVITIQPHHFGTPCGPKPPSQVEVNSGGTHRKVMAPIRIPMAETSIISEDRGAMDGRYFNNQAASHSQTAPARRQVRPLSALTGRGTNDRVLDDRRTSVPRRPHSALARQSGGGGWQGVDSRHAKPSNMPLPDEKNLDISAKHVNDNDLGGGARLRVKADDKEVDILLKTSAEDALPADWRVGIRDAIAQGVITAQTRLLLQVEYCTAERPSNTLRGSKEQYSRVVTDLKEKISTCLWEYNTTILDNRTFHFWAEDDCVTKPILKPRIGSCEIVLSWQHRSTPRSLVIHSKLQSRKWPVVDSIAEELQACLPVQYHDIRILAQSSTHTIIPKGAKVTVIMYEGSDPLGLIGRKTIAIADADGVAHINLPCGKYQIRVDHEKFLPKTFDYTLGTPASDKYEPFQRIVLHPKCEGNEIQISLIWNESPSDLDLISVTPFTKVWHYNRHDEMGDCHYGEDARKGYGPETISFKRLSKEQHTSYLRAGRSCNLHVYVHNYSEECVLTGSAAILTVTGEAGIIHQVEVPKVGVGDFWDAFSIDMRHLMIFDRNNLLPSEPSFDILRPDILEPSLDIDNNTGQDKGRFISSLSLGSRAVEINKEEVLKSPKSTSSMVRSVALLHDYHNYNGIR